jgi:hypothetical protein
MGLRVQIQQALTSRADIRLKRLEPFAWLARGHTVGAIKPHWTGGIADTKLVPGQMS